MGIIERLVYWEHNRILYPIVSKVLMLLNVEVPKTVAIGKNLRFEHRAMGTVLHPLTRIGDNVTIYHGVTIGSATPWDASVKDLSKRSGGGILWKCKMMLYYVPDVRYCLRTLLLLGREQ